jgi:hypothetical protein
MTARAGDPTTSPWADGKYLRVGASQWVAAKKVTCPSGQELLQASAVRDERSGTLVTTILTRCGVPVAPEPDRGDSTVFGTLLGKSGYAQQTFTNVSPGAPPPGYVWDPACACYKRARAA